MSALLTAAFSVMSIVRGTPSQQCVHPKSLSQGIVKSSVRYKSTKNVSRKRATLIFHGVREKRKQRVTDVWPCDDRPESQLPVTLDGTP